MEEVDKENGMGVGRKVAEILQNPHPFSDLKFTLENGEKINAHRLIVSLRSQFFKKLFYGSRREDSEGNASSATGLCNPKADAEVRIKNVSPKTFKQMLSFMYTDHPGDTLESAEDLPKLLLASEKYEVEDLVNFCKSVLKTRGIFSLYEKAVAKDKREFATDLWAIILRFGKEMLQSEDFVHLKHETLCNLLELDDLNSDEVTICRAVLQWAQKECRRQNYPDVPANLQKVLGRARTLIRYPVMGKEDFKKFGGQKLILLSEELAEIYKYYAIGIEPSLFCSRARNKNPVERGSWKGTEHNGRILSISQACTQPCAPKPVRATKKGFDSDTVRIKIEPGIDVPPVAVPAVVKLKEKIVLTVERGPEGSVKEQIEPSTKINNFFQQNRTPTPKQGVSVKLKSKTPLKSSKHKENISTNTDKETTKNTESNTSSNSSLSQMTGKASSSNTVKASPTSDDSSTSVLPWTPVTPRTPLSATSDRKRPVRLPQHFPKSKKSRLVTSSQSSLCSPSPRKERPKSSSITSSAKKTRKAELEVISNKVSECESFLEYAELIKICTKNPLLESISLLDIDVHEAYRKRSEKFDKVILKRLKSFNLQMRLQKVKITCLSVFLKELNIEEYLFFINETDINETFVKALSNFDIDVSVNGSRVLKVEDRSLTCAFTKQSKALLENVSARKSFNKLALGYAPFPENFQNFPLDKLRELSATKCEYPKGASRSHIKFLLQCKNLTHLILNGFNGKRINLARDLSCENSLIKLAISDAIITLPSFMSQSQNYKQCFPHLEKLVVFDVAYEPNFEDDMENMFPGLDIAVFGGFLNRPSFTLLANLLKLKQISTIEMLNFDWTTLSLLGSSEEEVRMTTFLEEAGITSSSTVFVLERTIDDDVWHGTKMKEGELDARRFRHFEMSDFFLSEKELKDYEELM